MTTRNPILALAGQWKLGDGFARVLAMLPEPRRSAVQACLAQSKPEERLAAFRERERLRVARLGRTRFGTAWDRLDPRLREAWLRTQR